MAPVHEEVHAEADRQGQQERQGAEHMSPVLDPDQHAADGQENAEGIARRRSQERALRAFPDVGHAWSVMGHGRRISSWARFSSSELPITDGELTVMATTPSSHLGVAPVRSAASRRQ
jgi:hypothetical protein